MKKTSLKEKDKQFVWHPFTQMKDWQDEEQLVITKGKGVYLWDEHGNKYIDGVSSLWVNLHGHKHPHIDDALKRQVDKLAHSTLLGLANDVSVELAEKLIKIAPRGLTKVFYSDNGSTAMEIAVKMAYQYWQQYGEVESRKSQVVSKAKISNPKKKTKFVSLKNAYHGDTIGSVSVGGIDLFHRIFKPLLFQVQHVDNIEKLETLLKKQSGSIAGIVAEPLVQGAAGMQIWPDGFIKKVRELCDKYDVLMICDEVATGFGRTGTMFACEQEAVVPDIMAIAKGLTAGYLPLAATLTKEKIYQNFLGSHESQRTFFHGHTYTGNPLGCAVALANLEIFEKEQTLQKLQEKIKFLAEELQRFNDLEHVGDIRQKGFMVGIELFQDAINKKAYAYKERVGHKVIMEARKQGVLIRPLGDTIILMPPLSISKEELKKLLDTVHSSIKKVTE
ncbi:adenosylmethionine--8-amino-7-oxononanoate transaminase [Candidatus Margulisiibacteriota bacterium]